MSEPQPRVLVIDDDLATRMLASAALVADGFVAREAGGGVEGLALFEAEQPDAILVDVNMPDLDGHAVCRAIRAHPLGKDLAIMVMTATDDLDAVHAAFAAGATDFMIKPLDLPLLGHRVRFMLRASTAVVEARAVATEVTRLAYSDRVTCLPNALFVERYIATRAPGTVVSIDLGTQHLERLATDVRRELTLAATQRVAQQLRLEGITSYDPDQVTAPVFLARMGFDELVVIGNDTVDYTALRATAEVLSRPFVIQGQTLSLMPRFGVAGLAEVGTPAELVASARYALQRADVSQFRNIVRFTEAAREQRSRHRELAEHLAAVLADESASAGLEVDLVPRCDRVTGALVGLRARASWTSAPRADELASIVGSVPNLAEHLAWWALARGCRYATAWNPQQLRIAFELPLSALSSGEQIDRLEALVRSAELDPTLVDLELVDLPTSRSALASCGATVEALRALGFRIVLGRIDERATIAQLELVHWDAVRVDRESIDRNPKLLATITRIAAAFDLALAVTGIDTPAALAMLDSYHCTDVSGAMFPAPSFEPAASLG